MLLAAGTALGPYEILSPLGQGGIGEVCRARDTRLGREGALKVLAEATTSDREVSSTDRAARTPIPFENC
jgi:serine/threonine protein kinase